MRFVGKALVGDMRGSRTAVPVSSKVWEWGWDGTDEVELDVTLEVWEPVWDKLFGDVVQEEIESEIS